jgi:hypothetical protein
VRTKTKPASVRHDPSNEPNAELFHSSSPVPGD